MSNKFEQLLGRLDRIVGVLEAMSSGTSDDPWPPSSWKPGDLEDFHRMVAEKEENQESTQEKTEIDEPTKKLCRMFGEQAKQCHSQNGILLLLAIKRQLEGCGEQIIEGTTELWEVADHLAAMEQDQQQIDENRRLRDENKELVDRYNDLWPKTVVVEPDRSHMVTDEQIKEILRLTCHDHGDGEDWVGVDYTLGTTEHLADQIRKILGDNVDAGDGGPADVTDDA